MRRRILRVAAIAAGLALGWMAVPWVQGEESPTSPAPDAAAPADDASAETSEPTINPPPQIPEVEIPPIPQADEDRPFQPVDPSKGPAEPAAPETLQEGKRLFHREGRVAVDNDGHTVFVFDSGDTPMRLIESRLREYLESVTEYGKKEARWRVSGVVTEYQHQNYLLLTKCVRMMPEEEGR